MDKKRLILGIAAVGICFLAGVLFATLYQTDKRTMKIYSQAMQDYANGDYQNSYYLFSKMLIVMLIFEEIFFIPKSIKISIILPAFPS